MCCGLCATTRLNLGLFEIFQSFCDYCLGGGQKMNIDIIPLVKMTWFIENHCIVGMCSIEREGVFTHKHF